MTPNIIRIDNKRQMDEFILMTKKLYQNDENFVFEPIELQREFFTKNHFFDHSQADFWMAQLDGKIVGRIASINNTIHNQIYHERTGFWGFFECVDNYEVAKALFDKVVGIHRHNGFDKIIGPTNFTTNDSCGFLTSGYKMPPVVMMPYNKPYYNDFLLKYGFRKEMDLCSYLLNESVLNSDGITRILQRTKEYMTNEDMRIRPIDYQNIESEINSFREIYNIANKDNWGFIPLSASEFRKTATDFLQFVPKGLILIIEKGNRKIGFVVALPDINQAFRKIKSGRLYPFGFLKFLYYKRKISHSRIVILGVLDEFRHRGIDLVLYTQIKQNLIDAGFRTTEACYVMENNLVMNQILQKMGGLKNKTYRIYSLELE